MDDLSRIIVLRPAELPEGFAVTVLDSTIAAQAATRGAARSVAASFLESRQSVHQPGELWQVGAALALHDLLQTGPQPREVLEGVVAEVSCRWAGDLAQAPCLVASEQRLADTLVALELVGDDCGRDLAVLAAAAEGYDALRRVAQGEDPVGLRPLAMPAFAASWARGRVPAGLDRRAS